MDEVVATRLVTPVLNPIDVDLPPLVNEQKNQKGMSVTHLTTLLKAKGIAESKPGFIQSTNTLSTRIVWINKAVAEFQRQQYQPLTPYQVWVILKVHETFYQVQPANHRQIALAVQANSNQFTYKEYINESRNTTTSSQPERDRFRQSLKSA